MGGFGMIVDITDTQERHITKALQELATTRAWKLSRYPDGHYELHWDEDNVDPPIDFSVILETSKKYEAEWKATEYQRLRKPEYPPLADFADAYYWAQQGDDTKMNEYLAKIQAIKDKYPKVTNAS